MTSYAQVTLWSVLPTIIPHTPPTSRPDEFDPCSLTLPHDPLLASIPCSPGHGRANLMLIGISGSILDQSTK